MNKNTRILRNKITKIFSCLINPQNVKRTNHYPNLYSGFEMTIRDVEMLFSGPRTLNLAFNDVFLFCFHFNPTNFDNYIVSTPLQLQVFDANKDGRLQLSEMAKLVITVVFSF